MRRLAAAASALVASAAWGAEGGPEAAAVREARRAVYERPEFRYAGPHRKSFLETLWERWISFVAEFRDEFPLLFKVAVVAMLLLLVALVVHIVWTLRAARRDEWESDLDPDLAAALRRGDPAPFRTRALAHADAGRLDEAVRDLYAALLLALDRRGALRYASSKALVDYRIEARGDADAAAALCLFAASYHPGSFGRRPPDRAHFDEMLAALDALAQVRS